MKVKITAIFLLILLIPVFFFVNEAQATSTYTPINVSINKGGAITKDWNFAHEWDEVLDNYS